MKQKIVLHGIGNEGNFNFYIFDKKQIVAQNLSGLFYKILGLSWEFIDIDTGKKRNIEKNKDIHESLSKVGGKSRVDIFYGNKKMFISVNCTEKLRIKFNEELFKIAKMPKPKKIKILKWKNRK